MTINELINKVKLSITSYGVPIKTKDRRDFDISFFEFDEDKQCAVIDFMLGSTSESNSEKIDRV